MYRSWIAIAAMREGLILRARASRWSAARASAARRHVTTLAFLLSTVLVLFLPWAMSGVYAHGACGYKRVDVPRPCAYTCPGMADPEQWTQADVRRWWTATLARYNPGDILSYEDLWTLLHLVQRHPKREHKIGPGVSSVRIEADVYGRNGFVLVRVDGSITRVGVQPIATRKSRSVAEKCEKACRRAVSEPIIAFAAKHADDPCALCGAPSAHVDHASPQFVEIFNAWAADGLALLTEQHFEQDETAGVAEQFRDAVIADAFRAYHDSVATLRMLCAACNLSRPKAARRVRA